MSRFSAIIPLSLLGLSGSVDSNLHVKVYIPATADWEQTNIALAIETEP
jgi:hypothetical protein